MSTAVAENRPVKQIPPGPGWLSFLGVQLEFMTGNPVDFMRRFAKEWGPVSSVRLGTFSNYIICEPELVDEVLMDRKNVFMKDALLRELDVLLGQGLLTSEGDTWRRQRKLAAPALKRKQIEAYADWMVELTQREMKEWSDGDEVELHHAMMALTLKIVVKTLFNVELEGKVDEIGEALDDAMDVFHKRTHTLWRLIPDSIPNPMARQFAASVEKLDEVVYDLIRRRREDPTEGDDLLYRLLIANDEEGGMTDKLLRDEVITMFLAGHETTALAVSYAWYLLSLNPDVARKMFDELDAVLGDRPANAGDVHQLPYLKAVVQETLRMYSPAWIVGREAMEDTTVGGWFVPKGTQVLTPQAVVHYDERYFEDPLEFRPERWLDPNFEKSLPRGAYFPFGGGARICIGSHFALMESMLMIATMGQHFDLENVMTQPLLTQPAVTLRPVTPISMRVHER